MSCNRRIVCKIPKQTSADQEEFNEGVASSQKVKKEAKEPRIISLIDQVAGVVK